LYILAEINFIQFQWGFFTSSDVFVSGDSLPIWQDAQHRRGLFRWNLGVHHLVHQSMLVQKTQPFLRSTTLKNHVSHPIQLHQNYAAKNGEALIGFSSIVGSVTNSVASGWTQCSWGDER